MFKEAIEALNKKSTIFGKVIHQFPVRWNMAKPTSYYAPDHIGVNPIWWRECSPDDQAFALGHEVMHILQHYFERVGKRDNTLFNIAADYNGNNTLHYDYGLEYSKPDKIPVGKYYGMSPEQIYQILEKRSKEEHKGCGIKAWTKEEIMEAKERLKALADSLTESEKQEIKELIKDTGIGDESTYLEQIFERQNADKVLRAILSRFDEYEVSYRKPNKRYLPYEMLLPGVRIGEPEAIAVCIDTSGSTQGETVKKFARIVRGMLRNDAVRGLVILCDNVLRKVIPLDKYKGEVVGGDGTSFAPAIERALKEKCKLILYFTDLAGEFGADPKVPVVWAVEGNNAPTPPFGKVIRI